MRNPRNPSVPASSGARTSDENLTIEDIIGSELDKWIELSIYNLQGQLLTKISNNGQDASGNPEIKNYANQSGLYLLHILKASGKIETRIVNIAR